MVAVILFSPASFTAECQEEQGAKNVFLDIFYFILKSSCINLLNPFLSVVSNVQ